LYARALYPPLTLRTCVGNARPAPTQFMPRPNRVNAFRQCTGQHSWLKPQKYAAMDVGIEAGLGDTGQISYPRPIIRFGTDRDRSVKPPDSDRAEDHIQQN
jgi:hypothetical protein